MFFTAKNMHYLKLFYQHNGIYKRINYFFKKCNSLCCCKFYLLEIHKFWTWIFVALYELLFFNHFIFQNPLICYFYNLLMFLGSYSMDHLNIESFYMQKQRTILFSNFIILSRTFKVLHKEYWLQTINKCNVPK